MNYFYCKCEWLARKPKNPNDRIGGVLLHVAIKAIDHNCDITVAPYKTWRKQPNGCVMICFMWRINIIDTFRRCLSEISNMILLENFQRIEESEFATGDGWHLYDYVSRVESVRLFEVIVIANESILVSTTK